MSNSPGPAQAQTQAQPVNLNLRDQGKIVLFIEKNCRHKTAKKEAHRKSEQVFHSTFRENKKKKKVPMFD